MDGESLQASHWFKQLLLAHKGALSAAASRGRFVLVPQTASLSSWAVTAADVSHHVLEAAPGAPRGEFRTLSGRTAVVTASTVVAGAGFPARVEATILAASTIAVELPAEGADSVRRQGRLQLYFLSRPLEGGIAAPSSVDELTADGIRKYIALLQSAPDVDECFAQLEAGVEAIRRDLVQFAGGSAGGGGGGGGGGAGDIGSGAFDDDEDNDESGAGGARQAMGVSVNRSGARAR